MKISLAPCGRIKRKLLIAPNSESTTNRRRRAFVARARVRLPQTRSLRLNSDARISMQIHRFGGGDGGDDTPLEGGLGGRGSAASVGVIFFCTQLSVVHEVIA